MRTKTAIQIKKGKLSNRYIEARDELKAEREKVCEDNDLIIAELERETLTLHAQLQILRWVEGSDK